MKHTNPLQKDPVWAALRVAVILGVIFILMSCVHTSHTSRSVIYERDGIVDYLTFLGHCFLLAGGCVSGGAFIGFIFGIPRGLSSPGGAAAATNGSSRSVLQNDNLVQISDWLTKIIVGVGLTQLTNIPPFLTRIGRYFAVSTGGIGQIGVNAAIIIFVYFTIIGFFYGYLWSQLFFPKMLVQMDDMTSQQTELDAFASTFAPEAVTLRKVLAGSEDPQKGKWGGKTTGNNREVTGSVAASSASEELQVVTLEVSSTSKSDPINGNVIFHLHPSFQQPDRTVAVENGVARLSFVTPVSFTTGVECDNGATKLEFDLKSDIKDPPPGF